MINYKNIVNENWIIIDQNEDCSTDLRIFLFKNYHFQDERFINLKESSLYDNKTLTRDLYLLGLGENCQCYCDYSHKWLVFDIDNCFSSYTRIYNIEQLFKE